MNDERVPEKSVPILAIAAIALSLGLFTTIAHVGQLGVYYLEEGGQLGRHLAVLQGQAGNPWQYRVLAPHLIEGIIALFKQLAIPYPTAVAFVFSRVVLDTFVLLLAYEYYRRLGLPLPHALLGMAVLAWGISYSHYDSDLQFNTFFDVIFYLLAALCILQGRYRWIIPITLLAALNRETSGLIPFLLPAAVWAARPGSVRRVLPIAGAALATYVAVWAGLRLAYGSQELFIPYGHRPGLELLQYNLLRTVTWWQLIATLNIVPLIGLLAYRRWPPQLRAFFWTIVPVWFVVHALGAVMAETRLFLVPQALVFIPAALWALSRPAHAAEPFAPRPR